MKNKDTPAWLARLQNIMFNDQLKASLALLPQPMYEAIETLLEYHEFLGDVFSSIRSTFSDEQWQKIHDISFIFTPSLSDEVALHYIGPNKVVAMDMGFYLNSNFLAWLFESFCRLHPSTDENRLIALLMALEEYITLKAYSELPYRDEWRPIFEGVLDMEESPFMDPLIDFVFYHEVGHIVMDHYGQQKMNQTLSQGTYTQYSKQSEYQADEFAMNLLRKNCPTTDHFLGSAGIVVLYFLLQDTVNRVREAERITIEYSETHPPPMERLERLKLNFEEVSDGVNQFSHLFKGLPLRKPSDLITEIRDV